MTEQLIPPREVETPADVRSELWESRHQLASLRGELRRGDEEYAALAAAYAAEHRHGAHLSTELSAARTELDGTRAAHAAELTNHANALAQRDHYVAALAQVTTERDAALQAAHAAGDELARARAEREAWLRTRTVRWTRAPRRVWGWWLAAIRR